MCSFRAVPSLFILFALLGVAVRTAAQVSLHLNPASQFIEVVGPSLPTLPARWNKVVQQLVVDTAIGPTLAADAYGTMHTAMYDAWTAFDSTAQPFAREDKTVPRLLRQTAFRNNAISWAAYTVLKVKFPAKDKQLRDGSIPTPPRSSQFFFRFSKNIGKAAAHAVLRALSGETPTDPQDQLYAAASFTNAIDRWFPEFVPINDSNGPVQQFLTPTFGRKTTFGIENGKFSRPPPPEPFLLVDGAVDVSAKTVTLANGTLLTIDSSLVGSVINPAFISQAEDVITYSKNLDDFSKLSAEFWEDGGGTSFPPGTWMTFGQFVSARDANSVDDDIKLFFILGNAVRDAGIATWNAKRFYFYTRPVRSIRDLGSMGLIGTFDPALGGFAVEAYDVLNQRVDRILASSFLTYQTPGSDPSPPFPEYTSGHSAFSASGAEVLKEFTGTDSFGASITFAAGSSRFEPGTTPSVDLTFAWPTFSFAADEAGLSRLHGGIHFTDGDVNGRILGRKVGAAVYQEAMKYICGKV